MTYLWCLAWLLAVTSQYTYGASVKRGAIIGLACASSFVLAGCIIRDPATILANLVFFGVHTRNLFR